MNNGYHYTGCGLDNVWLLNGYTLHEDGYGQSVAIDNLEGLHQTIGAFLVGKLAPLAGAEVRFLRIEMDLSQRAMGELMGREGQTVALWEKEESPLPKAADYLIRHIYKQFIGERSTYVEEVQRLRGLDQQEYKDGFRFTETGHGWSTAA